MAITKKMLIPVDVKYPQRRKKGFLLPLEVDGNFVFQSTSNHKFWNHGRVVFTGVGLSSEELYNKAKYEGMTIWSNVESKRLFQSYLNQIMDFKIGDFVKVGFDQNGIVLEKVNLKSAREKKLP